MPQGLQHTHNFLMCKQQLSIKLLTIAHGLKKMYTLKHNVHSIRFESRHKI